MKLLTLKISMFIYFPKAGSLNEKRLDLDSFYKKIKYDIDISVGLQCHSKFG